MSTVYTDTQMRHLAPCAPHQHSVHPVYGLIKAQRDAHQMCLCLCLRICLSLRLCRPYRILFSHNSHNIFAVPLATCRAEFSTFPHFQLPLSMQCDAISFSWIRAASCVALRFSLTSLWVHWNPLHFPHLCECVCACTVHVCAWRNGHIEGY